jgi:hypothetical protein
VSDGVRRAARSLALAAACAAAGCAAAGGGAAPTNTTPAPYPRPEGASEHVDVRRPTTGVAPQEAPGPNGAGHAPPPPPVRAARELHDAELELASAGDCATACRALRSMERAASHLCALEATDEDRRACDDARARVAAARDRVQRTCGGCGP